MNRVIMRVFMSVKSLNNKKNISRISAIGIILIMLISVVLIIPDKKEKTVIDSENLYDYYISLCPEGNGKVKKNGGDGEEIQLQGLDYKIENGTHTLTLTNFKFHTDQKRIIEFRANDLDESATLNIVLIGENEISSTYSRGNNSCNGIYNRSGDIKISGEGTLKVSCSMREDISGVRAAAIRAEGGNIYINSGKVIARVEGYKARTLYSSTNIYINGGQLDVYAGGYGDNTAIYGDNIYMSGGIVNVEAMSRNGECKAIGVDDDNDVMDQTGEIKIKAGELNINVKTELESVDDLKELIKYQYKKGEISSQYTVEDMCEFIDSKVTEAGNSVDSASSLIDYINDNVHDDERKDKLVSVLACIKGKGIEGHIVNIEEGAKVNIKLDGINCQGIDSEKYKWSTDGSVKIENASVNITGDIYDITFSDVFSSSGIFLEKSKLIIDNSKVSIENINDKTKSSVYGIYAGSSSVSIQNNSIVYVTADYGRAIRIKEELSDGSYNTEDKIYVLDSYVLLKGSKKAIDFSNDSNEILFKKGVNDVASGAIINVSKDIEGRQREVYSRTCLEEYKYIELGKVYDYTLYVSSDGEIYKNSTTGEKLTIAGENGEKIVSKLGLSTQVVDGLVCLTLNNTYFATSANTAIEFSSDAKLILQDGTTSRLMATPSYEEDESGVDIGFDNYELIVDGYGTMICDSLYNGIRECSIRSLSGEDFIFNNGNIVIQGLDVYYDVMGICVWNDCCINKGNLKIIGGNDTIDVFGIYAESGGVQINGGNTCVDIDFKLAEYANPDKTGMSYGIYAGGYLKAVQINGGITNIDISGNAAKSYGIMDVYQKIELQDGTCDVKAGTLFNVAPTMRENYVKVSYAEDSTGNEVGSPSIDNRALYSRMRIEPCYQIIYNASEKKIYKYVTVPNNGSSKIEENINGLSVIDGYLVMDGVNFSMYNTNEKAVIKIEGETAKFKVVDYSQNTIINNNRNMTKDGFGIDTYSYGRGLEIEGAGTLNIELNEIAGTSSYAYGIRSRYYCNINDTTINVKVLNCDVSSAEGIVEQNGQLTINNAKIDIDITSLKGARGINSSSMVINDSYVKIVASGTDYVSGLYSSGAMNVEKSYLDIYVQGGSSFFVEGIKSHADMNIKNTMLDVCVETYGYNWSAIIRTNNGIMQLIDSDIYAGAKYENANGVNYGIHTAENNLNQDFLIIKGCNIDINANSSMFYGIYANYGNLAIKRDNEINITVMGEETNGNVRLIGAGYYNSYNSVYSVNNVDIAYSALNLKTDITSSVYGIYLLKTEGLEINKSILDMDLKSKDETNYSSFIYTEYSNINISDSELKLSADVPTIRGINTSKVIDISDSKIQCVDIKVKKGDNYVIRASEGFIFDESGFVVNFKSLEQTKTDAGTGYTNTQNIIYTDNYIDISKSTMNMTTDMYGGDHIFGWNGKTSIDETKININSVGDIVSGIAAYGSKGTDTITEIKNNSEVIMNFTAKSDESSTINTMSKGVDSYIDNLKLDGSKITITTDGYKEAKGLYSKFELNVDSSTMDITIKNPQAVTYNYSCHSEKGAVFNNSTLVSNNNARNACDIRTSGNVALTNTDIIVSGTNITRRDGIYAYGGSISVTGGNILVSKENGIKAPKVNVLYVNDNSVEGCNVTLSGVHMDVYVIDYNASATIRGVWNEKGDVQIKDACNINMELEASNSYGIYTEQTVSISNSDVTIDASKGSKGYGIFANVANVSGDNVILKGSDKAIGSWALKIDKTKNPKFGVCLASTDVEGKDVQEYDANVDYKYLILGQVEDYAYKFYPTAGKIFASGSNTELDPATLGLSITNDGTTYVLNMNSTNISTNKEVALWIIGDSYTKLNNGSSNNLVSTGNAGSNYYGIKSIGSINLSGQGTLNVKKTSALGSNENYYGIYSNKDIIISEDLVNLSDDKMRIIVSSVAASGFTYGLYAGNISFSRANAYIETSEVNTTSFGVYADETFGEMYGNISINDGGVEIKADQVVNVVPTFTNVAVTEGTTSAVTVKPGVLGDMTSYKYVLIQPNYSLRYDSSNGKMYMSDSDTEVAVSGWSAVKDEATQLYTLVLDGLNFRTNHRLGLHMIGKGEIKVANGSSNTLKVDNAAAENATGIYSESEININDAGEFLIEIIGKNTKGIISEDKLIFNGSSNVNISITDEKEENNGGQNSFALYGKGGVMIENAVVKLNADIYNGYQIFAETGEVTIVNSNIIIDSIANCVYGLGSNNNTSINGSNINMSYKTKGEDYSTVQGIYSWGGNLNINSSTIDIDITDSNDMQYKEAYGIYTMAGSISILQNSNVSVDAVSDSYIRGIGTYNGEQPITINSSNVEVCTGNNFVADFRAIDTNNLKLSDETDNTNETDTVILEASTVYKDVSQGETYTDSELIKYPEENDESYKYIKIGELPTYWYEYDSEAGTKGQVTKRLKNGTITDPIEESELPEGMELATVDGKNVLKLNGFNFITLANRGLNLLKNSTINVVEGSKNSVNVYMKDITSYSQSYNIYACGNLDIVGKGELNIEGKVIPSDTTVLNKIWGIKVSDGYDLNIIDKVTINMNICAQEVEGIAVTNGNLIISNDARLNLNMQLEHGYGIWINSPSGAFEINRATIIGNIKGTSGTTYSTELIYAYLGSNDMVINSSTINGQVDVGNGHVIRLFSNSKIIISNSYVTATTSGITNDSSAIHTIGTLDIKGKVEASETYTPIFNGDAVVIPTGIPVVYDLETKYADYNYVRIVPSIISVDITWGALDYEYDQGTWDTQDLVYKDYKWDPVTPDDPDTPSDMIKVVNKSNVPITTAVTYAPYNTDYKDIIKGSILERSNGAAVSSPVLLMPEDVEGNTLDAYLKLEGQILNEMTKTEVGKVTIVLDE